MQHYELYGWLVVVSGFIYSGSVVLYAVYGYGWLPLVMLAVAISATAASTMALIAKIGLQLEKRPRARWSSLALTVSNRMWRWMIVASTGYSGLAVFSMVVDDSVMTRAIFLLFAFSSALLGFMIYDRSKRQVAEQEWENRAKNRTDTHLFF